MIKFAKITNDKTGTVDIAIGSTIPEGFTQMDVRQSDINGNWYLYDKAPMKTEEEKLLSAKELKLSEALSKAYEYENKTGFVTFEGRPVEYNNQAEDNIIQELSIELFNQSKFFQLLIAFSQGLLEEDFIYSTKEDANVYINALEAKGIYNKITEALTKLWTIDYPAFKQQINAAESIEEIDLIKIDYANNEEERN